MPKAKPEEGNMLPVGFSITGILTDYAETLPGLCGIHTWSLACSS